MRALIAGLLLVTAFLAGCLGGDDDVAPDESVGDDVAANDAEAGSSDPSGNDTMDSSESFEPETHTWDGTIPMHICAGQVPCTYSPTTERDDSNTFDIPEGATLASFNLTWDDGGVDFVVHVSGNPLVDEGEHVGPSPFHFEVPLDEPGTLAVSVFDHGGTSGVHIQGNDAPFHMELVVS